MSIEWIQSSERVVGQGHATLEDTINRPLRQLLLASGIDPDGTTPTIPSGAELAAETAARIAADADLQDQIDAIGGGGYSDAEIDGFLALKSDVGHTHAQADVTNLVADLAGKAASVHTHAQSDITGLVAALALLAPLASPALTGNPTAPTQAPGDNSTKIATTAYVEAAVAAGGGGGGGSEAHRQEAQIHRASATTIATWGLAGTTNSGSITTGTYASTNALTRALRMLFTGTTAANNLAGFRANPTADFVPGNGYKVSFIFGQESNTTGMRAFCGMSTSTTPVNADAGGLTDCIGIGYEAADLSSGNWILYHNDNAGAATPVDTGVPRDTTSLYRLEISTVDGTEYDVRIVSFNTGAEVYSVTLNSNVPTPGTAQRFSLLINNVATGVAAVLAFVHAKFLIGTEVA